MVDPRELDAGQWMAALRAAGIRGVILTAKHHDGVLPVAEPVLAAYRRREPTARGRGDLVREAADAAAEHGLAFGLYLAPWDRNAPTYVQGSAVAR